MEHISQELMQVREQLTQQPSSTLPKWIMSMLPEEQKILTLKYAAKPIARMAEDELLIAANTAILKIHVITGWAIPEPSFAAVLKDQFIKKMREDYASVNIEEVEYAFRKNGSDIKDWGKEMNIYIIDEVMRPYLLARSEVSKIEEQKKEKENLLPPLQKDRDQTMSEWMEETRIDVNEGNIEWNFLPLPLYDYMIEKELFIPSKEYKFEILEQAIAKRQAMLEPGTKEMSYFLRLKEAGAFNNKHSQEEEAAVVRGMCKKLTLFDYLWNL